MPIQKLSVYDDARAYALNMINMERKRQIELKRQGRFNYTPDEVTPVIAHAMLSEEVGGVARCALSIAGDVQEKLAIEDYVKECLHVAAVACAMVEGVLTGKAELER